jgi:hypothetical protein
LKEETPQELFLLEKESVLRIILVSIVNFNHATTIPFFVIQKEENAVQTSVFVVKVYLENFVTNLNALDFLPTTPMRVAPMGSVSNQTIAFAIIHTTERNASSRCVTEKGTKMFVMGMEIVFLQTIVNAPMDSKVKFVRRMFPLKFQLKKHFKSLRLEITK